MPSLSHYSRVVWYQLVKPRLWQWSTLFTPPVPEERAFRTLFPFRGETAFTSAFRDAVRPRLPFDVLANGDELRTLLPTLLSTDAVIRQADAAAAGRFAVFSDSPRDFGDEIDWHRDYSSGHRWPAEPYHRIDVLASRGSDMKFPCEVSKFHRLSWLGMGYLMNGEERYALRFAREITDWIRHNPVNTGINWTVPLEVAIRAVNWIQGYAFFLAAPLPDSFLLLLLRTLYAHGLYLEYNLEYVRVPGNHFACNCLGLVALGAVFRDTRAGRRWLALGHRFLEDQILRQNTPDGVNFEKSVPYHRFVTEIYTLAMVYADRAGRPFSAAYRERLCAMYAYMGMYLRPDGSAPMIGDADNGRILRFREPEDFNDQRDNLAVGTALFGPQQTVVPPSPDVLFTLGPQAVRNYPAARTHDTGNYGHYYADGGYLVHRSASHHLIVDIGDYGKQGRGGHGHNDCLSFELWVNGSVVLCDSGTGVYTSNSALRDSLRSTRAHNTVMYADLEQVEYAGVWKIQQDTTRPTVLALEHDANALHLAAEHYGYAERTGAIHRRTIALRVRGVHGEMSIADEIIGADPLAGRACYHLPPGITVIEEDNYTVQCTDGTTTWTLRSDTPHARAGAPYSPMYGVVGECTELCFPCNTTVTLTW